MTLDIPGVLFLYHRQLMPNASTIMEHVGAFQDHSNFRIWSMNTEFGFPPGLDDCKFETIVLHYSLFNPQRYLLNEQFLSLLDKKHSFKVAFFQDEHHYCQQRFDFLNRYSVDCVFTLVEPKYIQDVYGRYTKVPKIVFTIPGYVPDDLIGTAGRFTKADSDRRIDVGYRGRKLAAYMGQGALEKYDIAVGFQQRARRSELQMDIEASEHRRIYGNRWYRFMADCRSVLGVEAGVSIFDLNDVVRTEYERILSANPQANFETEATLLLQQWEGNIPYRTISPRHFEAAALRTCQILFEGKYSGIMQPMVHYIPLKKDFSNFDDVLAMFRDEGFRRELTENAYRDLIASGDYSYEQFVKLFDEALISSGRSSEISSETIAEVDRLLGVGRVGRQIRTRARVARHYPFPGRRLLRPLKPLVERIESMGAARGQ